MAHKIKNAENRLLEFVAECHNYDTYQLSNFDNVRAELVHVKRILTTDRSINSSLY